MEQRTARNLLFGPRRARGKLVRPVRRGRVHHVAYVINDPLYWDAVVYLSDHKITNSSDLPGIEDSNKAYEVVNDLQRWGWVERDQDWSLTEAGRRALAIQMQQ